MTQNSVKRKPRLDAERNRLKLLEVAKVAFAEGGINTSLEEIARQAGVGIGTLYRHFPRREILVDEIYRAQGELLIRAAEDAASRLSPVDALKEWLMLFIQSLGNKQIMAGVLECMTDEGGNAYCALSGEALVTALDGLLSMAIESGDVRDEITSLDLLCSIAGLASYGMESEWEKGAVRLVNVLIAGLSRS